MFATPVSWAITCWVRRASRTASSVGSASASSNEFVCSDCVPPSTAAIASSAVRTMFTCGCWAVSETPAVCVWKRISHERGSFAPYRSRSSRAQIRRAARYFAISSKKSMCALKKKDRRGANSSTSSPRSSAASTYANPSASVNASSCAAVEPASRMWYPEIEIGCIRGSSRVQNSIMSTTSRIDGSGGKMYSFCAMYSLRMSVWTVPLSSVRGTPCSSPTQT